MSAINILTVKKRNIIKFSRFQNIYIKSSLFIPDYINDIYKTFLETDWTKLAEIAKEIKNLTPAAMNTMLEKQSKSEAIEKWKQRKSMTTKDVPATEIPEQTGKL